MRQHVHQDLRETSIYGEHDGSIVIGVMSDDLPHMSEEDFYMAIIGVRKALKKLENQMVIELKHLDRTAYKEVI